MYADILNGLIFDAVYGSWILSLLLFTLGCNVAQNGLERHLRWTKIQNFPGRGMPLDLLAWAVFSTELLLEIVEIFNSVHKIFQELTDHKI